MNILHEIYAKLETLDTVSSKLDMFPVISDRLLSLENRVQGIQAEIVGIKNELHVHFHSERISSSDQLSHIVERVEIQNKQLYNENIDLKETVLDVQSRSMCDNLIFTNIPEIEEYESPEETENVVKIFVSDILQIVENFELHVAHRLRPRPAKHQGVLSQSLKNIKTVTKY